MKMTILVFGMVILFGLAGSACNRGGDGGSNAANQQQNSGMGQMMNGPDMMKQMMDQMMKDSEMMRRMMDSMMSNQEMMRQMMD
ncbi:MAG TPA: hypothetical protein VJ521_03950, partial [Acidobacteriota bacterium]|nr:hypothetical protein [Acidobacteriota bacterium]